MRHLGVHVGNFYLVEKAGGEAFTDEDEDEEVLVLFAAQAATAIANARTYRADIEALIETSPVGVVVFEARPGALVSLNREAARIVQDLCGPGQSAEQLLGVITCRRAETVRAEEVVLSVPDGRSVTDAHQRHPDPRPGRPGRRARLGGGSPSYRDRGHRSGRNIIWIREFNARRLPSERECRGRDAAPRCTGVRRFQPRCRCPDDARCAATLGRGR